MMPRCLMLCSLLVLWAPATLVSAPPPARMNVQVQSGQLRDTPAFLGKVVGSVAYGAPVTILQAQGDWRQVKTASGQKGWMHKSALTTKKISMSAGTSAAKTGASSSELALAGKGFNSDVEREFKAKNKNLNFAAVDRMEAVRIPVKEMSAFLKTGAVNPPEGGAR